MKSILAAVIMSRFSSCRYRSSVLMSFLFGGLGEVEVVEVVLGLLVVLLLLLDRV